MEERVDETVDDHVGTRGQGLEEAQLPRESRVLQEPHPAEKRLNALMRLPRRDWREVSVRAQGGGANYKPSLWTRSGADGQHAHRGLEGIHFA